MNLQRKLELSLDDLVKLSREEAAAKKKEIAAEDNKKKDTADKKQKAASKRKEKKLAALAKKKKEAAAAKGKKDTKGTLERSPKRSRNGTFLIDLVEDDEESDEDEGDEEDGWTLVNGEEFQEMVRNSYADKGNVQDKNDIYVLLRSLPYYIQLYFEINHTHVHDIVEIVFDLGRNPYYSYSEAGFFKKQEIKIYDEENENQLTQDSPSSSFLVNRDLIDHVLNSVGRFIDDNRAGIEGTLHRISRRLNRSNECIGLTIRVGRSVDGLYRLLENELKHNKSILLVGKPGNGKTTFLRNCCKYLSDFDGANRAVEVVDTSNEIAGYSDIPHASIGSSRRMMVSSRNLQHQVMLEAVQNHNPQSLVVDEIGLQLEVSACRDISQRGVQLIATAHGSTITDLVNSPVLTKLMGNVHSVVLSHHEIKRYKKNNNHRTIRERMENACFDVVVELYKPGAIGVITRVGQSVDNILSGKAHQIELRLLNDSCDGGVETSYYRLMPTTN